MPCKQISRNLSFDVIKNVKACGISTSMNIIHVRPTPTKSQAYHKPSLPVSHAHHGVMKKDEGPWTSCPRGRELFLICQKVMLGAT
mmetsp:Transcript_18411/g.38623  ORF Transcript_18411/g.38623 Transcript_18411/m.38623 type:complete len:86 (+) Transcript_18411:220-477(+)